MRQVLCHRRCRGSSPPLQRSGRHRRFPAGEAHRADARNFPTWIAPAGSEIFEAGEAAAFKRWNEFKKGALAQYDEARNMAGIDGTSKLSAHLKWGEIHPRTLLADLSGSKAHEVYRKEIAWR